MEFNLAQVHEAIAEAVPDRECIIWRDRRLTWRDVTERTRRLASYLAAQGLGAHRERAGLAGHESHQDHLALYLYNGNEYLEGMLGAFKASAVPFNVNYRYVDEELIYLFDNADARAIVYHACFAPTLSRIRDKLPGVRLWLQ
ncbi:MAG: AMP-binding protein, partial [Acidimicrobiales bacterium]